LYFQKLLSGDFKDSGCDYYESGDGGYAKIEIRRYWTTSDIEQNQNGKCAGKLCRAQAYCLEYD